MLLFSPIGQTILFGKQPLQLFLGSDVSGTTFNWNATGSSGNISGFGPGSGTPINQVLTNAGIQFLKLQTYTVIPTANNCTGTPVTLL